MKPEKLQGVYWKMEYLPRMKEYYYFLSLGPLMKDVYMYPIKEYSLNDCIFKFKKQNEQQ